MHQIQEIFRRKHQGESSRSIARNTGFSRTTVLEYLTILSCSGYDSKEVLTLSEESLVEIIAQNRQRGSLIIQNRQFALEGKLTVLNKELSRTGVTRLLLWQEYRKENPHGYGYTQFCHHLNQYQNIQQASMHFNHEPGECMMVDFAGDLMSYIDADTGEKIPCQVLVCVLPYSGYTYVQAMYSQKQEEFIAGLNNALYFFGGVPRNIKMDNLKSGVKKANRYDPDFTDLMNSFSAHFGINCTTSRVAKPKDKPHVEGAVLTAYRRIYAPLRDRHFFSLSELNAAMWEQLQRHHGMRFQNKPFTRIEMFLEEKPTLAALPDKAFEKYSITKAKVQRNYHVQLGQDKHLYSVPYKLIGKTLKIVYTQDTVEIYDHLSRVAFHQRISRSYGYTTLKEHMPDNHDNYQQQLGWDGDYFKRQGLKIGPLTHEFISKLLLSKDFIQQTYTACLGVLRLEKKYSQVRLEKACQRALLSPNITYRQLDSILKRGLDKAPLPDQLQQQINIPFHPNIRGKQDYQ